MLAMILTNNNQQMLGRLRALVSASHKVSVVTGYLTDDGFALLREELGRCLKAGGTVDIVVGHLFERDSYRETLDFARRWGTSCRIFVCCSPNTFAHGKLYLVQSPNDSTAIIGSSNLTVQGLFSNREINVEVALSGESLRQVHDYIAELVSNSVDIIEFRSFTGGSNPKGVDPLAMRLDRESVLRLRKYFDEVLQVSQEQVEDWCAEMENNRDSCREAVGSFRDEEWSGERFRQEFIMTDIWAISESGPEIKNAMRRVVGNRLGERVLAMVASAEGSAKPDEVLSYGRIPGTVGESIASEILHRYFPDRFPIKNKRSHWGLSLILDLGNGPDFAAELTYSDFIQYCDAVCVELFRLFNAQGLNPHSDYRYYLLDRLFYHISIAPRVEELIRLYDQSKRSERRW